MKKITEILKLTLIISFFVIPLSLSANGLIGCDGTDCDIYDLMRTLANIIDEIIKIAILFVAIIFAYAGWTYMTAGGDASKISKAHGMFKKSAVGFAIVLTAFLLVRLLLQSLGADSGLMIDLVNNTI